MIGKINSNKFIKKAILLDIKLSKDKSFLIWTFKLDDGDHVGFTPAAIYYGGKTHLWYSLLIGYFLPPSYNINFDTILKKECYAVFDSKGIIRNVVPIIKKEKDSTQKEETQLEEGYKQMKEESSQVTEEFEEAQKDAINENEGNNGQDIFQ